jgi:hypothetical protein
MGEIIEINSTCHVVIVTFGAVKKLALNENQLFEVT